MASRRHLLAAVLVTAFVFVSSVFSSAQSTPPASTTNAPTDASKQTQTAPPANKGLVQGAQEQIKKLQDYVSPPPPPPKDPGNPDVKVWADLHTALYYCPGSKQYGHTKKGKYMRQRDAEDNNFESALRVPCPPAPPAAGKAKNTKTAAKKPAPATSATSATKQQN